MWSCGGNPARRCCEYMAVAGSRKAPSTCADTLAVPILSDLLYLRSLLYGLGL